MRSILEQKGIEVEQIWSGSVQGAFGNDQILVILNTRLKAGTKMKID